jgi:hypothetical protein
MRAEDKEMNIKRLREILYIAIYDFGLRDSPTDEVVEATVDKAAAVIKSEVEAERKELVEALLGLLSHIALTAPDRILSNDAPLVIARAVIAKARENREAV